MIMYHNMPLKVSNYANTIIYKICCLDPTITSCYVGSTTDLIRRRCQHKHCCVNPKNKNYDYNVYQYIRENGGWENWIVSPIEQYPCANKFEALKRERYWLEELKADLNCKTPSRTKQEWTGVNKERVAKKLKEWTGVNKERVALYQKNYAEKNKELLALYKKNYREKNKEQLLIKKKEKYEANKEKILTKNKEQADCPFCSKTMRKNSISRHIRNLH
jgi:hypothetical protein